MSKLTGHRYTIVAINIVFGVLFGVSSAHAQSATAENLFADGNKLMAQGKFVEACVAFEASSRIEPRAGALLRLGDCRENNRQLASAWSAYKDALSLAADPRKRGYATSKIAVLEKRLSYLTVIVSDQSQITGLALTRNGASFDRALWNTALPVDGDDYVITAQAPGYDTWKKTVHVPVANAKLSVDVPILTKARSVVKPVESRPPTPSQPAATAATPLTVTVPVNNVMQQNVNVTTPPPSIIVVPVTEHSPASPQTPSGVAPIVVGAGALALLGSGLGLELWAESKYDAAKAEMKSQARRNDLYHSANTDRYLAETSAVGGLAAGAAAVWLYLRANNREHSPTSTSGMHLVPSAAGVAILGQF